MALSSAIRIRRAAHSTQSFGRQGERDVLAGGAGGGKPELAALARCAADADLAAKQLGDLLADGQAQAAAAITARCRSVGLGEGIEDAVEKFGGDADSGVSHRKTQVPAVVDALDVEHDRAVFGEFQCIADQVNEDLADPGRVAAQLVRKVGSDPGAQGQALVARLVAEHAHDAIDQRLQREVAIVDFEVAGFQAGKIENVVDQFE